MCIRDSISTEKRNEILANCKNADERQRTDELIRPILRGRDIKRYGYDWANLYLIATFPARNYDIERYPAVKKYLLSFAEDSLREAGYDWVADSYLADFCKQKLAQTGKFVEIEGKRITIGNTPEKARKKTNNKWFETQDSISYWEDFYKPKLVWAELSRTGNSFAIDTSKILLGNTGYILTVPSNNIKELGYIMAFMNSRIVLYQLDRLTTRFDDNGWRWLRQFVEEIKIPKFSDNPQISGIALEASKSNQEDISEQLNNIISSILGLNEQELSYINDSLKGY